MSNRRIRLISDAGSMTGICIDLPEDVPIGTMEEREWGKQFTPNPELVKFVADTAHKNLMLYAAHECLATLFWEEYYKDLDNENE